MRLTTRTNTVIIKSMALKYLPEYTFEEWANKVSEYEHLRAQKLLDKGVNAEQVLETMSRNITNKLLHFILAKFKESTDNQTYDVEKSRDIYFETMAKVGPIADHMNDAEDVL